ncbi:MAG: PAS domain-containing protein [Nitrospirales bacterium]|nr:PAS domain-containing protein [Nitrospira sp.]MDR4501468.1 PAS domain-containing protein [Nitrospirales bacterium]
MNHWLTKVPDKIFLWDIDGIYIGYYYLQSQSKHFVGPSGFLGKSIQEVLPTEAAHTVKECLTLALKTKQTQIAEIHLPLDGLPYTQIIRFVPYEDRVLGLVNDHPT